MALPEETRSRLLARLVRELLRSETFDSLADLADALKSRCAHLKILWTPGDISEAFALIDTNTPLVRQPPPRCVTAPPADPIRDPDRQTAAAIVRKLLTRYHAEHDEITHPLRDIGPVRELPPETIARRQFRQDQQRAFDLVRQAIDETAASCDALEATLPGKDET